MKLKTDNDDPLFNKIIIANGKTTRCHEGRGSHLYSPSEGSPERIVKTTSEASESVEGRERFGYETKSFTIREPEVP